MLSSMLADALARGTGYRARQLGFKLPAAGTTGSTNAFADAWFLGYTPHLVTGVWIGFDEPAQIMADGFGGVVAVPAWTYFMIEATAQHQPAWYTRPPDIVEIPVCPVSGQRASAACYVAASVARETMLLADQPPWPGDGEPIPAARRRQQEQELADLQVRADLVVTGPRADQPCELHGETAGDPVSASPPNRALTQPR